MLDECSLTKPQINWLIHVKKYAVNPVKLAEFSTQLKSNELADFIVADFAVNSGSPNLPNYILHFYLRNMPYHKLNYTMFLRFRKSNLPLIRMDVDGFHKNPDGEIIRGRGHMHFYTPGDQKYDGVAIAIDRNKFPDVENAFDTWLRFLKYIKLKEEA